MKSEGELLNAFPINISDISLAVALNKKCSEEAI